MIGLLIISFLNELERICLHSCIVSTQLNGCSYCYLTPIIRFNVDHLLHTGKWLQDLLFNTNYSIYYYPSICTVKSFQVLLYITNNSIKHNSFVYSQLNDQTVLFQTIQFSISHLFTLSLNVKKFYLTHWALSVATILDQSEPGSNGKKKYSAFPKAPALLEPHHQIAYCHIQDTRCGVLSPLQRC